MSGKMMTFVDMLGVVMSFEKRPFDQVDFAWLLPEVNGAEFVPNAFGSSNRRGLAHVWLNPHGAEFYLIKRFLSRGQYGDKHHFTLIIGHNGGELWEQGPTFINPGEMAEHLGGIASRYQQVRKLMGLRQLP